MKRTLYLVRLTYLKDLPEIDVLMKSHVLFLKEYYKLNKFIFSGRQVPRTGGIILCAAKDVTEVESIMEQDPFVQHKAASFEIIAFRASMCSAAFEEVLAAL